MIDFQTLMSACRRPALRAVCRLVTMLVLVSAAPAWAEQKQQLGEYEVHYVVFPTTFLKPEIADRYGITRGNDRAAMNVSVLNAAGKATAVTMTGSMTNLLGQIQPLEFDEVREGDAIYYLAPIKHTDRETLRFEVVMTAPGDVPRTLKFQQQMYVEER